METRAEKAYKIYKACESKKFKSVSRYDLNKLYNVLCRIKKDTKYAKEIAEFNAPEGEPLEILIEKYFYDYNNLYGLEIRDDLIEYENPDLTSGSFFKVDSFINEGGNLVKRAPTEFLAGEVAHVTVSLLSNETNSELYAPILSLTAVTDDGEEINKTVRNSSLIEFDITLSRPGSAKFKVVVLDTDEKPIMSAESAYGGILFSRKEISTTHCPPKDLRSFWEGEIDRLLKTNPCDTTADKYSGKVETIFDISEKNRYKLVKLDTEYAERLKSLGQPAPTAEELCDYDIYETNLKSPGPCPATAYVSVPKRAAKRSIPIHFIFDGYGVRMPAAVCSENQITVHCAHHGYELCRDVKYYQDLWDSVCRNYCRGNGKVNSDFTDIHDCYPLYLLLRNLQMLRFLSDPSLSSSLNLLHKVWNGNVSMSGSSMGGFQTICGGALASILRERTGAFTLTSLSAPSPAFGNVAGSTDNRVTSTFFTYKEGADYFDTAILATLLDTQTDIPRASLGDEVCPITTITAIYNSIPKKARREIRYIQNSSHGYLPDEEYQNWIVYND